MRSPETVCAQVTGEDAGERADRLVAKLCGFSRQTAQRLIEEGNVLVNGEKPAKSRVLCAGETLRITVPPLRESVILPQNIPLDILCEDEWLLVVNKPKGMVVHPAAGNPDGTLVNALLHHCGASLSGIGGEARPGIVHRIDKDTSGLLVVAKNDFAHQKLAEQFAAHNTEREYRAVVYGGFAQDSGEIDAPIGRSRTNRKKMAVAGGAGKSAVTRYTVLERFEGFTHLSLQLYTGRTHQIRVHMANIGHPLAGDAVYGPKKVIKVLHGQCLHAKTLGFTHPATNERMRFDSTLPAYFTEFLTTLGRTV